MIMRLAVSLISLALLSGVFDSGHALAEHHAGEHAEAQLTLIHCGSLLAIPGQDPMSKATIVVRGERIDGLREGFVSAREFDGAVTVVDLRDSFVLPGMIDCHTHITGEMGPGSRTEFVRMNDAQVALRATTYARATLEAGFTTIRNVGSRGSSAFALRDAINQGYVVGPRILCAGRSISPTGGHGDIHGFREGLLKLPTAFQGTADGVDGCRKAVRAQVKRGADVIKLTATGGVLSQTNAGTDQQFFDDELKAIVDTAHSLGRKVAAHAHGTTGLNAALRAGVDSIEHGSFIDDESISLFKQSGAYLVPTLLAGKTVLDVMDEKPDMFPASVRDKAAYVGPAMMGSFGKAYRAGVKIAFGTDSGVSVHGTNAEEFALMVEAGMSEADAIQSATEGSAKLCGLWDEIGSIEYGKFADIVAVSGDPMEDITELERVRFVMRSGNVIKSD